MLIIVILVHLFILFLGRGYQYQNNKPTQKRSKLLYWMSIYEIFRKIEEGHYGPFSILLATSYASNYVSFQLTDVTVWWDVATY